MSLINRVIITAHVSIRGYDGNGTPGTMYGHKSVLITLVITTTFGPHLVEEMKCRQVRKESIAVHTHTPIHAS